MIKKGFDSETFIFDFIELAFFSLNMSPLAFLPWGFCNRVSPN